MVDTKDVNDNRINIQHNSAKDQIECIFDRYALLGPKDKLGLKDSEIYSHYLNIYFLKDQILLIEVHQHYNLILTDIMTCISVKTIDELQFFP